MMRRVLRVVADPAHPLSPVVAMVRTAACCRFACRVSDRMARTSTSDGEDVCDGEGRG